MSYVGSKAEEVYTELLPSIIEWLISLAYSLDQCGLLSAFLHLSIFHTVWELHSPRYGTTFPTVWNCIPHGMELRRTLSLSLVPER